MNTMRMCREESNRIGYAAAVLMAAAVWAVSLLPAAAYAEGEQCPLNSLWSQAPEGALEETSDAQSDRAFADNFFSLNGPIHDVHWWGYYTGGALAPCVRNPNEHKIAFYENDSGEPGALVAEYTVTPIAADTGIVNPDIGLSLYRHDAVIDPPLALETGWVSIQGTGDSSGCEFLPASSTQDGVLRYFTATGVEIVPDIDAAWCLTGASPGDCPGNVVQDPGFELGRPNPFWVEEISPDFGEDIIRASCGVSGSYCAFLGLGGAPATIPAAIYQEVTIPAAPSATLRFQLRVSNGTAGSEGEVPPDLIDFKVRIDTTVVFSLSEVTEPYASGYAPVEVDISAFADGAAHVLRFSTVQQADSDADPSVDEVCIETAGGEGEGEGEPPEVCEGNLLNDGGFELGRPNPHWEEFFDPGFTSQIITMNPALAHSGSYFANMGGSAEGDDLMLKQEGVTIPYGASATLEFYLRVFVDGFSSLTVKLDDFPVYVLNAADAGPYAAGYALVSVDLSDFADGYTRDLFFHTWAPGGYSLCAYIDDVCLTIIGPETCPLNSWWSQPPQGALTGTSYA